MTHDQVVEKVFNYFRSLEKSKIVRKNFGGYLKPDIYMVDENKKIHSVECKGSSDDKREYITGIGQAVAYLSFSNYSYLAIPYEKLEEVENFLTIKDIGLIAVSDSVEIKRKPKFRNLSSKLERLERGYAYYRDIRPNEIKEILEIIRRNSHLSKQELENKIWNYLQRVRNIRTSRKSWILNISLLLRDLNIVDSNFKLTKEGYDLSLYDDNTFKNKIKSLFLNEGNYKSIVLIIDEERKKLKRNFRVNELKNRVAIRLVDEKLSRTRESAKRDLEDIFRILRDLEILDDDYFVNWRNVIF